MDPLTVSILAGTALSVGGSLYGASNARREADNRATALKAAASRRLLKGGQEAGLLRTQAKMDQTSYATNRLSSGTDRETLAQDTSLGAITNRADFMATQALSDAQFDAEQMMTEGSQYQSQAKNATTASWINAGSSILGTLGLLGKTGAFESGEKYKKEQSILDNSNWSIA